MHKRVCWELRNIITWNYFQYYLFTRFVRFYFYPFQFSFPSCSTISTYPDAKLFRRFFWSLGIERIQFIFVLYSNVCYRTTDWRIAIFVSDTVGLNSGERRSAESFKKVSDILLVPNSYYLCCWSTQMWILKKIVDEQMAMVDLARTKRFVCILYIRYIRSTLIWWEILFLFYRAKTAFFFFGKLSA